MSDLSRLLDDVYGTTSPAPTPAGWATETAKVFTGWLPDATGPAPAVREPEVLADPVDALERILEQSAPAAVVAEPEAVVAPESQPLRAWRPEDDDILPAKAPRRRLALRRR